MVKMILTRRKFITQIVPSGMAFGLSTPASLAQVAPLNQQEPFNDVDQNILSNFHTKNEFDSIKLKNRKTESFDNIKPLKIKSLTNSAPLTNMKLPSLRGLWLINANTGDELSCIFWNQGKYNAYELSRLSWMLRDWRENKTEQMDPVLFHLLWAVQYRIDFNKPIFITSGYRTPKTNALLRSEGAAINSLHMERKAVDIVIQKMDQHEIARYAQTFGRGGVGFYSRFTHIDTGRPRTWGT